MVEFLGLLHHQVVLQLFVIAKEIALSLYSGGIFGLGAFENCSANECYATGTMDTTLG